jgi:hypothetical protein
MSLETFIHMMTLDAYDIMSRPSEGLPPLMNGWHRRRLQEGDTTFIVFMASF